MLYLLLIYDNESDTPKPGDDGWDDFMGGFGSLTREVREKGIMVAGEALESVTTATTVRVRGGKTETTDGPFAETKEQLGGFYLLDCKDLDEAIEYAAKIPTATYGSIEVRPIKVYG